jgi:hypothetical protein
LGAAANENGGAHAGARNAVLPKEPEKPLKTKERAKESMRGYFRKK